MKLLVCGGRDFINWGLLKNTLNRVHAKRPITLLIHGAARGADALAGRWADENGIECTPYPADWERYRNRAGPIRNAQMLRETQPELVIAFPGGSGTQDMITRALDAATPVLAVRGNGDVKRLTPREPVAV